MKTILPIIVGLGLILLSALLITRIKGRLAAAAFMPSSAIFTFLIATEEGFEDVHLGLLTFTALFASLLLSYLLIRNVRARIFEMWDASKTFLMISSAGFTLAATTSPFMLLLSLAGYLSILWILHMFGSIEKFLFISEECELEGTKCFIVKDCFALALGRNGLLIGEKAMRVLNPGDIAIMKAKLEMMRDRNIPLKSALIQGAGIPLIGVLMNEKEFEVIIAAVLISFILLVASNTYEYLVGERFYSVIAGEFGREAVEDVKKKLKEVFLVNKPKGTVVIKR